MPLSRRFGYAVINIYLPSLIMAIVGYLTLFFLTSNFEARVMTALTTLLVLATISNQVYNLALEGCIAAMLAYATNAGLGCCDSLSFCV